VIYLDWKENSYGMEAVVPAVECGQRGQYEITAIRRPAHCDRGSFLVQIYAAGGVFQLDNQEGFPRYYFSVDAMKSEMQAWVNKRQPCLEAVDGKTLHAPVLSLDGEVIRLAKDVYAAVQPVLAAIDQAGRFVGSAEKSTAAIATYASDTLRHRWKIKP